MGVFEMHNAKSRGVSTRRPKRPYLYTKYCKRTLQLASRDDLEGAGLSTGHAMQLQLQMFGIIVVAVVTVVLSLDPLIPLIECMHCHWCHT